MIVTNLNYHLENRLLKKLDIMITLCTNEKVRKDAVLIIEGSEGEGKTNSSEAIAYYLKEKTNRSIHMFFRLKPLMDFAQNTEEKIIIWDEPALDSLSMDWWKEANKDLIRMLMTCRKKRHFFLLNFVKFYKFSEYVVVDRALGLIHMYSRKGTQPGRFVYIRRNKLEYLYTAYRNKKRREYKKFKAFGGWFPNIEQHFGKLGITVDGLDNATLDDYERLKDNAIRSIGKSNKDTDKLLIKLQDLRQKLGTIKCPINDKEDLANKLNISSKTLYRWSKLGEKLPKIDPPSIGHGH